MRYLSFRWIGACLLLVVLGCSESPSESCGPVTVSPHRDYLGRYRLNDDLVLVVSDRDGLLTLLPSFWHRALILDPVAGDRFRSVINPEMEFSFHRDAEGLVSGLEVSGSEWIAGTASRLSPAYRLPVEALLVGEADEALRLLKEAEEASPDRALGLARQLLISFPSLSLTAADFLVGVAEQFPTSADGTPQSSSNGRPAPPTWARRYDPEHLQAR